MLFPIDIILNGNPGPIRDRMPKLEERIADVIDKALVIDPSKRVGNAPKLLKPFQ